LNKMVKVEAECMRREACAKKIQKVWRNIVVNPEYECCRRRLMREWCDLTEV
jgi:hypothetical protein